MFCLMAVVFMENHVLCPDSQGDENLVSRPQFWRRGILWRMCFVASWQMVVRFQHLFSTSTEPADTRILIYDNGSWFHRSQKMDCDFGILGSFFSCPLLPMPVKHTDVVKLMCIENKQFSCEGKIDCWDCWCICLHKV